MSPVFLSLYELIDALLSLYQGIIIVSAILSWLVAFDIVNRGSRVVQVVGDFCYRLTEPALRPIRRLVPAINGIDLAPLVLFFAIWFVRRLLLNSLVYL